MCVHMFTTRCHCDVMCVHMITTRCHCDVMCVHMFTTRCHCGVMSAGTRKEDAKALIATSPMKILGVDNLDDAAMMVRLSQCIHTQL